MMCFSRVCSTVTEDGGSGGGGTAGERGREIDCFLMHSSCAIYMAVHCMYCPTGGVEEWSVRER